MIGRLRGFLVRAFWRRFYRQGGVRTWMHEPRVRRSINEHITGSEDLWPLDWFQRCYAATPFPRGLSLGCGHGLLERDVMGKGLCTAIVGVDLSEEALAQARAAGAGIPNLEYRRGDMDRLELASAAYDIVFFHQSLHHVADLEGCLDQVRQTLRPGGKVYLDEYVGPSRSDWHRRLLADAEAVFRLLPEALKRRPRLDIPVDWRDPSEAVRSAEIVAELARRFTLRERRDYGGNLLAVIHPYLRHDRLDTPEGQQVLATLIAAERDLLANGAASFYTVLVGEPR